MLLFLLLLFSKKKKKKKIPTKIKRIKKKRRGTMA
jgi:hypothetical protein